MDKLKEGTIIKIYKFTSIKTPSNKVFIKYSLLPTDKSFPGVYGEGQNYILPNDFSTNTSTSGYSFTQNKNYKFYVLKEYQEKPILVAPGDGIILKKLEDKIKENKRKEKIKVGEIKERLYDIELKLREIKRDQTAISNELLTIKRIDEENKRIYEENKKN